MQTARWLFAPVLTYKRDTYFLLYSAFDNKTGANRHLAVYSVKHVLYLSHTSFEYTQNHKKIAQIDNKIVGIEVKQKSIRFKQCDM